MLVLIQPDVRQEGSALVLAIGDDAPYSDPDPWVEDEREETILDAANIPVPTVSS